MGTHDHLTELMKERELRLPAHVTLVATANHIEWIKAQPDAAQLDGVIMIALPDDTEIPSDVLAKASLVILEVDPVDRGSMKRLSAVRVAYPDLPVIVAIADANVALVRTLIRQGVADVVSLPFNVEELLQAAVNATVDHERAKLSDAPLAPLVAVVRAVGGSGGTTIATHLASQLSHEMSTGRGVCLIDLDIQYGSVAGYLNIAPRRSIFDLLEATDRLDGVMLRSVAVEHHKGLNVITAPEEIIPLETIRSDELMQVIEVARREFDCVVLDLPSNWTNWNLSAVVASDVVLMVVDLSIASLRQAKRRLDLFGSVGVSPKAIGMVVNRVEKRLFRAIGLDDVEKALGHRLVAGVSAEGSVVSAAQDQGLFVGQINHRSRFATDMSRLATSLQKLISERTAG